MTFDHIVSLGYNCAVSESLKHFKLFSGRSPLDWHICTPSSTLKFLSFLYGFGVDATIEKFKVRDKKIDFFSINSPHYDCKGDEKFERRIHRFNNLLIGDEKILFVYVFPYKDDICPFIHEIDTMIRIAKILRLFRSPDLGSGLARARFCLAVLHAGKEVCPEVFLPYGIDEISLPSVPEEKYWIFPLCEAIKEKYKLEQDSKNCQWNFEQV